MKKKIMTDVEIFLTEDNDRKEFIEGVILGQNNEFESFLLRNKDLVLDYNEKAQLSFVYIWLKHTNLSIKLLNKDLILKYLKRSKIYSENISGMLYPNSRKKYNIESKKILELANYCFSDCPDSYSLWVNSSIKDITSKILTFVVNNIQITNVKKISSITPKNFSDFIRYSENRIALKSNKKMSLLFESEFIKKWKKIKQNDEYAYYSFINEFQLSKKTQAEKNEIFNNYMKELIELTSIATRNITIGDVAIKINIFYMFFNKKEWNDSIIDYLKNKNKILVSLPENMSMDFDSTYTKDTELSTLDFNMTIAYAEQLGLYVCDTTSFKNVKQNEVVRKKDFIYKIYKIDKKDNIEMIKKKLFPDSSIFKSTSNSKSDSFLYINTFLKLLRLEETIFFKNNFKNKLTNVKTFNESYIQRWSIEMIEVFTEAFIIMEEDLSISEDNRDYLKLMFVV